MGVYIDIHSLNTYIICAYNDSLQESYSLKKQKLQNQACETLNLLNKEVQEIPTVI